MKFSRFPAPFKILDLQQFEYARGDNNDNTKNSANWQHSRGRETTRSSAVPGNSSGLSAIPAHGYSWFKNSLKAVIAASQENDS